MTTWGSLGEKVAAAGTAVAAAAVVVAADVRRGWALASWLQANNAVLHVNDVIWQGHIWSRAHDAEGWRPYTGGGHYPSTGPTYGHYGHVHVSTVD